MEEGKPLPTPRLLLIDEFARRKGHCYDTILCDLEARQVLEVSAGRKPRGRGASTRTAQRLREGGSGEHGYESDLPGGRPVVPAAGAHRG